MRNKVLLLFFAVLSPLRAAGAADSVPRPVGWVNDFADVLPQEQEERISAVCGQVEEKTGSEIAVVTIASIAPHDEQTYCRLLFDAWQPGKKGKDNGLLVLLAVKERRWRIETGYGLESVITDGIAGDIGRRYMVPYFKNGSYGEGLLNGVKAAAVEIYRAAGITVENSGPKPAANDDSGNGAVIFGIFVLFALITAISRVSRHYTPGSAYPYGGLPSRHHWGDSGGFSGGGFGGFGGGGGGGGGAGGGF